jgi:hypothetical protein
MNALSALRGPGGVLSGHKIYMCEQNVPTSILWWLVVPTLCCSKLVVGVISGREREEFPSLVCVARPKDYGFDVLY